AEEVAQYELPVSTRHYGQPFRTHVDLLDETIDRALARQIPAGSPTGLMLSGGLDSRILAGFLHRRRLPVTALTHGLPGELDLLCARRVARTLGFPHLTGESERTVGHADLDLQGEHLAGGFIAASGWANLPQIRQLPGRMVTGLALDAVTGDV